jgi:hypothetical protein
MTKRFETTLLDFLTNAENLPFVVDILEQSSQIRRILLKRFWSELSLYLSTGIASLCPAPVSMKLWPPSDDSIENNYVSLWYSDSAVGNVPQCLSHAVYHWRSGDKQVVYACIARDAESSLDPKLSRLDSVVTLRKYLDGEGFKKEDENWFGYKGILKFDSMEKLLRAIAEDCDVLARRIGDFFLSFVEATLPMVVQANKEILAVSGSAGV